MFLLGWIPGPTPILRQSRDSMYSHAQDIQISDQDLIIYTYLVNTSAVNNCTQDSFICDSNNLWGELHIVSNVSTCWVTTLYTSRLYFSARNKARENISAESLLRKINILHHETPTSVAQNKIPTRKIHIKHKWKYC